MSLVVSKRWEKISTCLDSLTDVDFLLCAGEAS